MSWLSPDQFRQRSCLPAATKWKPKHVSIYANCSLLLVVNSKRTARLAPTKRCAKRTFKASAAQLDTDWPCLNLCPDFFRRYKLLVFIGFKRIKLDLFIKRSGKGMCLQGKWLIRCSHYSHAKLGTAAHLPIMFGGLFVEFCLFLPAQF